MDIIRDILTGTLTKDHFNYIVHQMKMYQIDVKECARFIFENAIFYHRAAPYYAKVCKEFGSLSYSVTEAKEQNVFLFYLFCFCKEEYNNHVGIAKVYIAHERRKKKIMKNKNSVNKHLLPVMDKGLSDLQHRANGLGNFIGELLKLGLIPNQTFWHFINVLMSPIANCEFCIDFVCHFLLSADGKFKSKIDIQKLRNIMDYFEHQIKSNQHKYDSRAWPAVRKVLGMKKHWIPPLRMKTVSLKHVVNQTKASEIPLDENVYEIIKGTTIENIDQIAEQLNNDISISPLCLHGTVDFLIEKGIKNSLPDNIFAHLCAKINILASQNLNESFKDRLIACCQKEFEYQVCNRLDDSIRGHEKRKKRLMGTVQFMGALFNVNLLCDNIILRCLKYLLDPATISEDSIECLSHFMTTIGGIGGKEKKFKQTILQLRAVIKELETKYSVEIQDSLWNLLESLKTLDKSENTSFLGQTSSVKFKKKKNSKKIPSSKNNISKRSSKETKIMNTNPPQKTVNAIENLNIYIIPTIHGNVKLKNTSLVGEQLKWTIKFIFETLIDDSSSIVLNANMCCKIGHQIGMFNSCLIEFCQREFECHRFQASVYQRYDVHLQTILNTERDAIKQKEYCCMLEKSIEKESQRSIAIVNFICELYRLYLIPEQVIEYCLITLLSPQIISEVSLKCVRCILMKFDKTLRVPVNTFERLHQIFSNFSCELLNRYTVRVRIMIDDTVNLVNFTKHINSQPIGVNVPLSLNTVQHERVLNHNQHLIPPPISKEKDELLKRLRELQTINDSGSSDTNKDVLNAFNEIENSKNDPINNKNSASTNDVDKSEVKMNESLDNVENSQIENAIERNVVTIDYIQKMIKEVNSDHENAKIWANEIAKTNNKPNADRLITELMLELKRNLCVVANYLEDEDVKSILKEIEFESSFKKREELKNVLLGRLDAPHDAIGNVKLFAELYNIGLLDYEEMIKIMNNFLESESINHVTIECFCEFMARVGSKMDSEYHCHFVYFVQKLKRISTNGALKINNRTRCMIENCLNNNFYQNF